MRESQRIKKLFQDLYAGEPWIDVNLVNTLEGISAVEAELKKGNLNSIWQIVNHIIEWRLNVLQRIQGKTPVTPENNFFSDVTDTSEKAWEETKLRLESTQNLWINYLENFDEKEFLSVYPPNKMSYYEHIQGILQHDAYHMGQIVVIAKLLKQA